MGLHTNLLGETVAFRCHGLMVPGSLEIDESFRTVIYCSNIPLKDSVKELHYYTYALLRQGLFSERDPQISDVEHTS